MKSARSFSPKFRAGRDESFEGRVCSFDTVTTCQSAVPRGVQLDFGRGRRWRPGPAARLPRSARLALRALETTIGPWQPVCRRGAARGGARGSLGSRMDPAERGGGPQPCSGGGRGRYRAKAVQMRLPTCHFVKKRKIVLNKAVSSLCLGVAFVIGTLTFVKNIFTAARTATHCQREADWARCSFTYSVASRRRRRPRRRRRLSTRRLSASSPLVRAVLGLPRRYNAFPFLMVQGACCCFATSPGAYASRAFATTALNALSSSWLVL